MKMCSEKEKRKTPCYYPISNVKKKGVAISKGKCEQCDKIYRIRNLVYFKGKWLCGLCRSKRNTFKSQQSAVSYIIPPNKKTLKDVLNKVYEVKVGKNADRDWIKPISFPRCMIGHKFKIVLIENE